MRDLRRAIGDDAQQIVRTIARRGYLFALPLDPPDAGGGRRRAAAGGGAAVPQPDRRRGRRHPARRHRRGDHQRPRPVQDRHRHRPPLGLRFPPRGSAGASQSDRARGSARTTWSRARRAGRRAARRSRWALVRGAGRPPALGRDLRRRAATTSCALQRGHPAPDRLPAGQQHRGVRCSAGPRPRPPRASPPSSTSPARVALLRSFGEGVNERGRDHLLRAIEIDPGYGLAHAYLALVGGDDRRLRDGAPGGARACQDGGDDRGSTSPPRKGAATASWATSACLLGEFAAAERESAARPTISIPATRTRSSTMGSCSTFARPRRGGRWTGSTGRWR